MVLVQVINPGVSDSHLGSLIGVGVTLFFTADGADGNFQLWKSDGTALGTYQVQDIQRGDNSSAPSDLTVVGDTLFFSPFNRGLWALPIAAR